MTPTTMKKTDERQAFVSRTEKAEAANCFGVIVYRHYDAPDPHPDNQFLFTVGVKPNKGDPSNTHAEYVRKESIKDMVHAAAKDVGLQAVLKQVSMGLRPIDSLLDDGEGSIDDTLIPEYVGDIGKQAAQAKKVSDDLLRAAGVDPSTVKQDNLEQVIQSMVNEAVAKMKASNADNSGGDK